MKTILLVRHAKSSWEHFRGNDEDRPLNERGKKDAPEMARRLLKRGVRPDKLISSPALRALTTAELFAGEYGIDRQQVLIVPALYMAGEPAFTNTIRQAPPEATTIALFSHNNGITLFANMLSPARIDHMPTCSVFAVNCPVDDWGNFYPAGNDFYFFETPKAGK